MIFVFHIFQKGWDMVIAICIQNLKKQFKKIAMLMFEKSSPKFIHKGLVNIRLSIFPLENKIKILNVL